MRLGREMAERRQKVVASWWSWLCQGGFQSGFLEDAENQDESNSVEVEIDPERASE